MTSAEIKELIDHVEHGTGGPSVQPVLVRALHHLLNITEYVEGKHDDKN